MRTYIEGILLKKVPFQERHIIGTLLLRSGEKLSVLFYGGLGGGSKQKGSSLQLGFMVKVHLQRLKRTDELARAKDWDLLWHHQKISLHHQAFYLACFFMELIERISIEADPFHDEIHDHSEELFNVLSNSLYWLEFSLEKDSFNLESRFFIFLAKLCVNQGVFPELNTCCFCDKELALEEKIFFVGEQGGFSCSECVNLSDQRYPEGKELALALKIVSSHSFKALEGFKQASSSLNKLLLHYYCEQFHVNKNSFKSLQLMT